MGLTTMGWFSFIFGIIGAICIATFTYPSFFRLLKTKDSSGISMVMYLILAIGSTAFILNGILAMVENSGSISSMIGVTIANFLSGISAWTCFGIRVYQGHKAKKEGLTIEEYCKKHHPVKKGDK